LEKIRQTKDSRQKTKDKRQKIKETRKTELSIQSIKK